MLKRVGLAAAAILACGSAAQALPSEQTFTSAGLGPSAGWTLLGPQVFGTGGNGFLSDGGGAVYSLRLAAYEHRFGLADTSYGNLTSIFDTGTGSDVSDTAVWVPATNPFLFYFEGDCINCQSDDGLIFSDGHTVNDANGQLDFAIYQNNSNPDRFALFFDDGGGGGIGRNCATEICDDDDYNDMVITVQSSGQPGGHITEVVEPGSLAAFGIGLAALGLLIRRRR